MRAERREERGNEQIVESAKQISDDTLISSLPNIKVDNEIICEVKL